MWKYLKMIPLMAYPYAYLIPLIVLFVTPAEGDNMDTVYLFVFAYGFAVHILALLVAILNSVFSGIGRYTVVESAKINMITKCVQIPAYLFHFFLGLLGLVMSIWGIGVILFAMVVDLLTITFTGISSIGCSVRMAKEKVLPSSIATLTGIGCFLYVMDVPLSIFYYVMAKRKENIKLYSETK